MFWFILLLAPFYTVDETTILEFQPRAAISDVFPAIAGV